MLNKEEKSVIFLEAILNAYKEEDNQVPVKQLELNDDVTEDFLRQSEVGLCGGTGIHGERQRRLRQHGQILKRV